MGLGDQGSRFVIKGRKNNLSSQPRRLGDCSDPDYSSLTPDAEGKSRRAVTRVEHSVSWITCKIRSGTSRSGRGFPVIAIHSSGTVLIREDERMSSVREDAVEAKKRLVIG